MSQKSIVMMGATGAVGSAVVKTLMSSVDASQSIAKLTLLGRRQRDDFNADFVAQKVIDILEPQSYLEFVSGHDTAICTLGVGDPATMSREQWLRIDKTSVLDFAQACKESGVKHFQMLTSIGSSSKSKSYYLGVKGQLEDALEKLEFDKLSLFQPSMILTPTNRYGVSQAIILNVWPTIGKIMLGPLSQYRGIEVAKLGAAIANNSFNSQLGVRRLRWQDFIEMANPS